MTTTIALLNMKGGVGKTTLAVNLAWHLGSGGAKRVLLVDLDPQFNASQYVLSFETYEEHRTTRGTIANLLIDEPMLSVKKAAQIKTTSCILTVPSKQGGASIDILPSELRLSHVVKNPAQMDFKLEKRLGEVRDKYAYVILDCAPTDSVLTTMALNASDYILAPVRPDRFSILGFYNLRESLDHFKDNCNNPHDVKDIGVVFTQVRNTSTVEEECMDTVRQIALENESYVFNNVLPFSDTLQRSVHEQTSLEDTRFARPAIRESITNIAKEMQERIKAMGGAP